MDTTRTMITFKQGEIKFTYRIGGIVIHNGCVLFQRATLDPEKLFWFLPGGRAELGENAEATLSREMIEELGEMVKIERLLYIAENFYTASSLHHELGLYFLMSLPESSTILQEKGTFEREEEGYPPLTFEWLPIEQLPERAVFPGFLRTALSSLPEQTTHIVQKGE